MSLDEISRRERVKRSKEHPVPPALRGQRRRTSKRERRCGKECRRRMGGVPRDEVTV